MKKMLLGLLMVLCCATFANACDKTLPKPDELSEELLKSFKSDAPRLIEVPVKHPQL